MSNREDSISMLGEIYEAAEMGVQGSELLRNKSEDSRFSAKLQDYVNKYGEVKEEAARLLSQYGEQPKEAGAMKKTGLWTGVQLNTMIDKTSSHMAEMLIEGSTMGTIQGVKSKNAHPGADPACTALEDRFLNLQQSYTEDMKKFLI